MNEWEQVYLSGAYETCADSVFLDLLSRFIARGAAVVELGCGIAVNTHWFIKNESDYAGVDASETAIAGARKKYPALRERFVCADFTKTLPIHGVQAVCERASIAHNDFESIKRCIALIYDALPTGGIFVSGDWFSTGHSEYGRGTRVDDHTFTDYPDGQFGTAGAVHFSSESELRFLFEGFDCMMMLERVTRYVTREPRQHWARDPAGEDVYQSAVWDMAWRKL